MKTLWGEGLCSHHYWGQRITLRRNRLVYEVSLRLGSLTTTFVIRRKTT